LAVFQVSLFLRFRQPCRHFHADAAISIRFFATDIADDAAAALPPFRSPCRY